MKLFKRVFLIGLSVVLFSSCAKIFYSSDAKVLAAKHKTIAIVPPTVTIAPTKKLQGDALKEQQKGESLNFQKEMYSWMLKRKRQGKISQEIQEIQTTNAKLSKAGYPETPTTTAEICEVLGVDAIMTSSFGLSKPMSEAAAVVTGLLTNFGGSTNEVHVSLSISDCGKS